ALAKFRGVDICHFFYAADHLSEGNWDARNLMNHMDLDEKDKIALLALEFACDWIKP
ncbi:MAG: phosphorylase, partial [Streptococcus thermophilus]